MIVTLNIGHSWYGISNIYTTVFRVKRLTIERTREIALAFNSENRGIHDL